LYTNQGALEVNNRGDRIGDEIIFFEVIFKIMLELKERSLDVTLRVILVCSTNGGVPKK